MPGPDGVGIGGNMPRIISLTDAMNAGNVGNVGNINGVQPGGAQPKVDSQSTGGVQTPVFREPTRAFDVAGQLDVLLLKAVKGSTGEVDVNAVAKAAKSAKLPAETRRELQSLAEKARDGLSELDKFTGKDLAASMEKKADGTIGWKDGNMAAKAFEAAQEAQGALSSALAKALGNVRNDKAKATLEEMMLQCDRRMGEIDTLVLQMAEIIDAGGENAERDAAALAGGGKIGSFTSASALDKFGRAEMLGVLKSDLKPLTDRLAAYANDGMKNLTKADMDACMRELNAVKAKFSAAAASGELEVGGRTVFMDRSLLGEASRLLDGVGKKIGAIHREVLHAAMVNFVEKDIPFIDDEIFSPKFAGELHKLGKDAQELEDVIKLLNSFRSVAREYAESPTGRNAMRLRAVAIALADAPTGKAEKCMDFDFIAVLKPSKDMSLEFKNAFENFQMKVLLEPAHIEGYKKLLHSVYYNIEVAAEQLVNLGHEFNEGPKEKGKYFVSGAVLDVFKGETSLSPLLESRVHGYSDSDVNTSLDDKNVAESRTLGKGNFNTVTLIKTNSGSEWVFKPELAGRLAAPGSSLNDGLDANQEMTRINLAVQTTADTLGLGDIMVKTSAGTHKGQFGMFMEKAPGITGKTFKDTGNPPVMDTGKAGAADIDKMDDADFGKAVGRMMRQFNRMMWFDTITGQGDRHADNYMIDIDKTDLSVTVKTIDNDASYGVFRKGLYKFSIGPGSVLGCAFNDSMAKFCSGIKGGDKKTFLDNLFKDPGLTRHADGSIEIDLEKADNRFLLSALLQVSGVKSFAPPAEIDKELFDKLMTLAKDAPDGGVARRDYLSSLADRLGKSSEQYSAAVRRLDESIAHARKLNAAGKVYSAEQWEEHDIQREIASPNRSNRNEKLHAYNIDVNEKITAFFDHKGHYSNYTNTFFRDFYECLIDGKKHANWFDG